MINEIDEKYMSKPEKVIRYLGSIPMEAWLATGIGIYYGAKYLLK